MRILSYCIHSTRRVARYKVFLFSLWVACLPSADCWSQELQSMLTAHFNAVGQPNLSQIRSLLMEIKEIHDDGGIKEYSIVKKRPNRLRIEGVWETQPYVKAYDGQRAWTIAPWTGTSIPQLMTEKERDDIVNIDGIDSPLYDTGAQGYTLSQIEDRLVGGRSYYCIRVEAPGESTRDFLLNKENYLIYKLIRYHRENPSAVAEEVFYKDYRDNGGLVLPMGFEIRRGQQSVELVVKEIILGYGAPSSLFRKPD